MAKTIEHTAIDMLNRYGWKYDNARRSPAWIDPLKRTDKGIYLGSRGSIRLGTSKTDSRPLNGLDGLTKYLERIEAIPVVPVDTSVIDAQRKANDERKAELVKLHNALRGITPVYLVNLLRDEIDNDQTTYDCIFAQEPFSRLDEVEKFINDRPGGSKAEVYVKIITRPAK